jgi:hypothetical protein
MKKILFALSFLFWASVAAAVPPASTPPTSAATPIVANGSNPLVTTSLGLNTYNTNRLSTPLLRAPGASDDSTQTYSQGYIANLQFTASGSSGNTYANLSIAAPAGVTGCTTATVTLTISGGSITNAVPNATGTCYGPTQVPKVVVACPSSASGTCASLTAVPNGTGGIGSYTINNGGTFYAGTPGAAVASANGCIGAVGHGALTSGVVSQWVVDYAGSCYIAAPTITATTDVNAVTPPAALTVVPTLWNYQNQLWTPNSLLAGYASWSTVDINNATGPTKTPYACAIAGATYYGCYGTILLNPSYSGYAFRLVQTNSSATSTSSTITATTLTVGGTVTGTFAVGQLITGIGVTAGTYIVSGSGSTFTVSNSQTVAAEAMNGYASLDVPFIGNYANYGLADSFSAAGGGSFISILYDQKGAQNYVYNTVATAPIWTGNVIGNIRPITFVGLNSPSTIQYLSNSTASYTPTTMSVTALGMPHGTLFGASYLFLPNGTPGNTTQFEWARGSQIGVLGPGFGTNFGAGVSPDTDYWIINGTSAVVGNSRYQFIPRNTSTPAATATGGSIGYSADAGGMMLGALIIQNSVNTTSIQNLVNQALLLESGVQTQASNLGVDDGDSRVWGSYAYGLRNQTYQIEPLTPTIRWYNTGVPGQTLATKIGVGGGGYSQWLLYVGDLYDAGVRNFVFNDQEFINDAGANATAATIEGYITTEVSYEKGLGPNVRVVLLTEIEPCTSGIAGTACPSVGRFTPAQNAVILAVNAWERANYATIGADAVADLDNTQTDPLLAGSNAMYNTVISPDGLHFNPLGYGIAAAIVANVDNSVLQ